MKSKKTNTTKILFVAILLLQLVCMFFYANAKQGYFVDELWSYGLANSYYHPDVGWNGALQNGWVTGNYFHDYLRVLPNQRFAYGSVIYNQVYDYHPPLFYMVLHTISSFFPNTFSKWYALIPNIIYFAISMLLLFVLAKRIFKNEWLALVPVIAYGFSAGAISNVVFLRMYVLLTVWVLALLDLHVKWILNDRMQKKDFLLLVLVAYLGFMTHYYFFLIAFFTSAFYFFYLLFKKRFADLVKYCVAMLISLLLVELTFPIAFLKLFSDQRGDEAVQNFFGVTDFVSHAKTFWNIMGEGIFANSINAVALILLVGGTITVLANCVRKKRQANKEYNPPVSALENDVDGSSIKGLCSSPNVEAQRTWISIFCMSFVVVIYFVLISKIAPYLVDRYLFGVYPIIVLIVFFLLYEILHYWSTEKVSLIVMLVLASALALFGFSGKHVQYLYPENKDNVRIMEEHEGDTCLYITNEQYMLIQCALELEHMGMVIVGDPDNIEASSSRINTSKDEMIVYIPAGMDQDDTLRRVCAAIGFTDWKPLFTSGYKAYELTR